MLNWLRTAWRAKDGLAAVEFAMLAPIMAALFLGSIELCDSLDCEQKVTGMASTAADLIAQETSVSTSDMSNVYAAINSIVYPYPTTGLKIVVSSLLDNGAGGGKVVWSCAQNGTVRATNSVVTVPTGVITSGGSVILTEISYPYSSPVSDYLTGTTYMTSTFYSRPRRSASVTGPSSCP